MQLELYGDPPPPTVRTVSELQAAPKGDYVSDGLPTDAYTFPYVATWATDTGSHQPEDVVTATGQRRYDFHCSDDRLGQGKYQAGPAAMIFHMGRPWVTGLLLQHRSRAPAVGESFSRVPLDLLPRLPNQDGRPAWHNTAPILVRPDR